MVTWQTSKEWWGKSAVAYHKDMKASIQEMDGKCFWYIREDEEVVARGVIQNTLEAAMDYVAGKLSWLSWKHNLRRLIHGPSAA